jgi:filamentous hemagglutinin family protein
MKEHAGMNRFFRLVWSAVNQSFVVVAEHVKVKGYGKAAESLAKPYVSPMLLGLIAVFVTVSHCTYIFAEPAVNTLPTQGQIVGGTATISQSGNAMTIQQSSSRAAIDWNSFNVGRDASVTFQQPNQSAVILNRVVGNNPSEVFGRMSSTGQVFVVNPGGVYFSPTASVNVGGLVATTHNISPNEFMAGGSTFNRNGATGSVINDGHLSAVLGGYIALLAPEVRNNGVVLATQGTIAMGAGENITLNFTGNRTLVGVTVSKSTIAALVENKQAILAPDGLVILSAQSADNLKKGIVNNAGSIEAKGMVSDGGRILLEASDVIHHTGSINVDATQSGIGLGGNVIVISDLVNTNSQTTFSGTISAKGGSAGGDGGFVETSGSHLKIADSAKVVTSAAKGKSGTWLLDPDGFTISTEDGADMTGLTLSRNLIDGDVVILSTQGIQTQGIINVNDNVTWSANKLILTATNDINIRGVMRVKGTGTLEMNTGANHYVNVGMDLNGFVGSVNFDNAGTGLLKINGQDYTVINELGVEGSQTGLDLQGINNYDFRNTNYALGKDINASLSASWNGGKGFDPLYQYLGFDRRYNGNFNGLGHSISNLTQKNPGSYAGLFGYTGGNSVISNIFMKDVSILTDSDSANTRYAGGLVAQNGGLVRNIFVTGDIDVLNSTYVQVGGIAGDNFVGRVENVLSNATVTGRGWYNVGGIVGYHENGSTIDYAYSASTVISGGGGSGGPANDIAGLVSASTILNSSRIQLPGTLLQPVFAAVAPTPSFNGNQPLSLAQESAASEAASTLEAARKVELIKNINEQISKVIVPPPPPVLPSVSTPPPTLVASNSGTSVSAVEGTSKNSSTPSADKNSKGGSDKSSGSAKDSDSDKEKE